MSANTQSPRKSILKTSLPSAYAASAPPVVATATTTPPTNSNNGCNSQRSEQQSQFNNTTSSINYYKSRPGTDPRHMAIALHHAHRIQARKDAETLILNSILELVSFPSGPAADPASPSADDAKTFKLALRPFQPSDYDNLILERNIEGLCGYGLCPREHRKEDPKAKNRIVLGPKRGGQGGRGREMQFVPKEKLEMWCSDECAERALYVKVQLQEQPVWERGVRDERQEDFLLLEEARDLKQKGRGRENTQTSDDTVGEAAHQLGDLQLGRGNGNIPNSGMRELARERGDSSPALEAGRVGIQLIEKESVPHGSVASPSLRTEDRTGGSIEGHIPKEIGKVSQ